jgi:hypothetical protein
MIPREAGRKTETIFVETVAGVALVLFKSTLTALQAAMCYLAQYCGLERISSSY